MEFIYNKMSDLASVVTGFQSGIFGGQILGVGDIADDDPRNCFGLVEMGQSAGAGKPLPAWYCVESSES